MSDWVEGYLWGYLVALIGYEIGFLRRWRDLDREARSQERKP